MREKPDRSWRFLHPGTEAADEFAGLCIAPSGGVEMVDGGAAVRQSIRLLLSTMPGERVMRPEYGCELHRLIFSPNDDTTKGLAIHYVRRAIERWETRAQIVRLDAVHDPLAPTRLVVLLEYRLRAAGRQTYPLTFSIDLAGPPS
jgi:phage baseplate assembly protein W